MDDKEFGAKLKAIRVFSGHSVPEISEHLIALGYKASEKTIYSWEAGRSQPTPDAFLDFCKYCGITDVMSAFGYKKSPSADKSTLRDEREQEIMRLVGTMSSEQKDFFLALLQTTVARNQGTLVVDPLLAAEATPKSEHHDPTR